ncbi:MAG: glycosyltransferase family 4 protein, partial [Chloroflexales bacterium]|nr:glycosyltransferase family 4 protein [Chloroflexales bacterium]
MRVLMLSWEYPPHVVGGLGKHVAELAPALAAQGITTTVLTPLLRDGAPIEALSPHLQIVRIVPPRMEDYGFVTFVEQTNHAIERAAWALHAQVSGFDLIHAHDWLTASAAVKLKHAWRIPLITTIHATERGRGRGELNGSQSQRINHLEWELTYEAWRVIVCSGFMANQAVDHFSTPRDKIDVVPNGVQLLPNPFASLAERQAFRRRFAADEEAIVFYVGRVVYEKGLHVLLWAWPQIAAQVRARLVIAGAGSYLDDLKEQAAALDINHQVYFTGFIADDDRDRLYHVADVAAFPSLYEPFGIVAIEAFAAGCPVVAASTGGLA